MEKMENNGLKCLNRDVIKYIAMFTMFWNHFATVFLKEGTVLCEALENFGYFTAITMCYFLVEGYDYTRSKKKYGLRLFLFAEISEFPFILAFGYPVLNMLFTLFCCFLILVTREKIKNNFLRRFVEILLVLVTFFSDWPLLATIFTILFARNKGNRKGIIRSYVIAYFVFVVFNLMNFELLSLPVSLVHSFVSGIMIIVSGIVILCLYNGKRAERGRTFSKWFFYIFYPAHLLVLGLIRYFYLGQSLMPMFDK